MSDALTRVEETRRETTDLELREAIELRFSRVFGSLNFVNALAGRETHEWWLARRPPIELIREADRRGLDLAEIVGAVEGPPLLKSPLYQKVRAQLDKVALRSDGLTAEGSTDG